MFEQFAAFMRSMSRGENKNGFTPRPGQSELIKWILDNVVAATRLCVRWPGGYGKTIGIALAYIILRAFGRVDRLLVVVANDQQRSQFQQDFAKTCKRIGFEIACNCVWSFDKTPKSLRISRDNKCEVFVTTIQMVSATNRKGTDSLLDLINNGRKWMLAADEYHHYAQEKDWGTSLQRICNNVVFSLAMSATPTRDGNATIFGDPDLIVTYLEAVQQKAVKKLWLRRYHYTVKATIENGNEIEYTTDELRQQLENESLDNFEERVGLRYTTRYIHPMILEPLMRLENRRVETGKPLQMLVRAMSCRHAKFVCSVIQKVAPGLRVDWVGSGPAGRTDDENSSVIKKFVPGAGLNPELDVLVQIQKVSEGSDSIMVCEIVDLALANIDGASNQLKQFIFRGSRIVPGLEGKHQYCNINVPSDSKLAGLEQDENFIGLSLMDWIDGNASQDAPLSEEQEIAPESDFIPIPENFLSVVVRRDAELTEITNDMEEHFMRFVDSMNSKVVDSALQWDVKNNPEHREHAKNAYLIIANDYALEQDIQAQIEQQAQKFDSEVGRLAKQGAKILALKSNKEITGSLIGEIKKKINAKLKITIGCSREAWMQKEFDYAGRILHAWGCALRDHLNAKDSEPFFMKESLPWLN